MDFIKVQSTLRKSLRDAEIFDFLLKQKYFFKITKLLIEFYVSCNKYVDFLPVCVANYDMRRGKEERKYLVLTVFII